MERPKWIKKSRKIEDSDYWTLSTYFIHLYSNKIIFFHSLFIVQHVYMGICNPKHIGNATIILQAFLLLKRFFGWTRKSQLKYIQINICMQKCLAFNDQGELGAGQSSTVLSLSTEWWPLCRTYAHKRLKEIKPNIYT